MSTKKIIVAIDGFSSCGKSTMAKTLAREAGYIYVDTGAMYRAVALFCMRRGWLDENGMNAEQIEKHISEINLAFYTDENGKNEMILNGENVEKEIRVLAVSNNASRVSTLPAVRRALVHLQQVLGQSKGIVMDGRDIGTVVFPEAELKVFLKASPEVRARRRYDEIIAKGDSADYEEVLAHTIERDERDQNRAESPLKKAEDAVVIDNSEMTPDEQQEVLRQLFKERIS